MNETMPVAPLSADIPAGFSLLESAAQWWTRILGWLELGGPVVWVLLVLGTIAVTIVLLKTWQFAAARMGDEPAINQAIELWRAGRHDAAIRKLLPIGSPRARVLGVAMAGIERGADEALLREETERRARAEILALGHSLRPLEFIANVSPLIGLLGTVIGMIGAFQGIELAGSQVDPAVLSGGIWIALLTTAVGLLVAIPVSFLHGTLERRLDNFAHSLGDAVTRVFTAPLEQVQPAILAQVA